MVKVFLSQDKLFFFLVLLSGALYMFGFLVLNTYVNEYIIAVKNDTIDQKPHYKGIVKATYKTVPINILNFFFNAIIARSKKKTNRKVK